MDRGKLDRVLEALLQDQDLRLLALRDFEAFASLHQLDDDERAFFVAQVDQPVTTGKSERKLGMNSYKRSYPDITIPLMDIEASRKLVRLANPDYYVRPVTVVTTTTTINTVTVTSPKEDSKIEMNMEELLRRVASCRNKIGNSIDPDQLQHIRELARLLAPS